ncbi:FRG domain-containing protein [Halomonas beimenensis]|nr:FRG domain-containing protein [Halomonas beimenensis]
MKHDAIEVATVSDLIATLRAHSEGQTLWYRGQGDKSWPLVPSIVRAYPDAPVETEWALLKRFRQNAPRLLSEAVTTEWEWLFLMQHYGVETRLLDWTESPLLALYFSVYNDERDDTDAALWVLDPLHFNHSNNCGGSIPGDFPFCGVDNLMEGYLTRNVMASVQSPQNPIAAMAPRSSARIAAQLGVFTVFHADFEPLENLCERQHVWKYIIPAASKPRIRKDLEVLQINKFSLFPELANAAQLAKERING